MHNKINVDSEILFPLTTFNIDKMISIYIYIYIYIYEKVISRFNRVTLYLKYFVQLYPGKN